MAKTLTLQYALVVTANLEALRLAASREAAYFSIRPAQIAGRAVVQGYAIDGPRNTLFTTEDDAGSVLHASFADVGSFISGTSAIHHYAAALLTTHQYDDGRTAHLLPPSVTLDTLNLVDGQLRPAATVHIPVNNMGQIGEAAVTYDAIRATHVTHREADERYFDEGPDGPFARLEQIARGLYAARTGRDLASLPTPEHRPRRFNRPGLIGQFIINETTAAVNAAMGQYMQRRGLSGIYRIPILDDDNGVRYRYTPSPPADYNRADQPLTAPFTAPLTRYRDLLNHLVVAAHEKGRQLPFRSEHYETAGERITRIEHRLYRRTLQMKPKKTAADYLAMPRAQLDATQLGWILFGNVSGTPGEVEAIRDIAFEQATRRPEFALNIVKAAVATRCFQMESEPRGKDETIHHIAGAITRGNGERFPHPVSEADSPQHLATKILNWLLDRPIVPTIEPSEKRYLEPNALRRLAQLNPSHDLSFSCFTAFNQEAGMATASAYVILNGITHRRDAIGQTERLAAENASAMIWIDLHPAEQPAAPANAVDPSPPLRNASEQLHIYVQQNKVRSLEYSFESATYGIGHRCIATYINNAGEVQKSEGYARKKRDAQHAAAVGILRHLDELQAESIAPVDGHASKTTAGPQVE